jgi:hypothetical protein
LGRVRWFETGTVELYVRKPANLGKAVQLFCDAFTKTEVVTDIRVIEECVKRIRVVCGHAVFETPQRLPYKRITAFKETNGIEILVGDRSHPNAVEIVFEYQEQVKKVDLLLRGLLERSNENINRLRDDRGFGLV